MILHHLLVVSCPLSFTDLLKELALVVLIFTVDFCLYFTDSFLSAYSGFTLLVFVVSGWKLRFIGLRFSFLILAFNVLNFPVDTIITAPVNSDVFSFIQIYFLFLFYFYFLCDFFFNTWFVEKYVTYFPNIWWFSKDLYGINF